MQTDDVAQGTVRHAIVRVYEKTEIALRGQTSGRRLFQSWRPGSESDVIKARVNNRDGFSKALRQKNRTSSHRVGRSVPAHGTKS
jgi:hypothetical protein